MYFSYWLALYQAMKRKGHMELEFVPDKNQIAAQLAGKDSAGDGVDGDRGPLARLDVGKLRFGHVHFGDPGIVSHHVQAGVPEQGL